MRNLLIIRLCATLVVFGLIPASGLAADVLAVLQTKTEIYKNVTLVSRTPTHLFVQHSRGVANIKIQEFNTESLRGLGISDPNFLAAASAARVPGMAEGTGAAKTPATFSLPAEWQSRLPAGVTVPVMSRQFVRLLLGALALTYLFFCYCLKLICLKAGKDPGFLVWLPVLNIIPMIRAAGMSGWWFVAWLVPGLNLLAQVLWAFRIAQARGKSAFTGIFLILPGTNLLAFLYLAFSGGQADSEDAFRPLETEPLPA